MSVLTGIVTLLGAGPAAAAGSPPVITAISVTGRTADATTADARFPVVVQVTDPDGDVSEVGVMALPSGDPDPVLGGGHSVTQVPEHLVSTDGGRTFTGHLVLPAGFAKTWTLSALATDAQDNLALVTGPDVVRLGAPASVATTVSAPPVAPSGVGVQGVWTYDPLQLRYFYQVRVSWNRPPAGTPVPAAFKILATGSCVSQDRFVAVKTQAWTIGRSADAGLLNPICNVRIQVANSAGASAFTAAAGLTF